MYTHIQYKKDIYEALLQFDPTFEGMFELKVSVLQFPVRTFTSDLRLNRLIHLFLSEESNISPG